MDAAAISTVTLEEPVDTTLTRSATLCIGITSGIGFSVAAGVIRNKFFVEYFADPSDSMLELFVGTQSAGCAVGALLAGPSADYLGRRTTLMLATIAGLIGSVFMAKPMLCQTTLELMCIGRVLSGVCNGALLSVWPVYLNETVKADDRGANGAMLALMLNTGVLSIMACEFGALGIDDLAWCWCLAGQSPFLVLLLLALRLLPESPSWLHKSIEETSTKIDLHISDRDAQNIFSGRALLAVLLVMMQGASGIDLIVNYLPSISANSLDADATGRSALFYSMGAGAVLIGCTILASFVIDHFGRRTMLLVGSSCMSLSMLSASFATARNGPLCIYSLLAFTAFFGMTWAPLGFIVPSELVPFRVRASVVSIGTVGCFLAIHYVVSTWLSLVSAIGQAWALLCYAGINAMIFGFIFTCLPETADLKADSVKTASLEAIHYGSTRSSQEQLQTSVL